MVIRETPSPFKALIETLHPPLHKLHLALDVSPLGTALGEGDVLDGLLGVGVGGLEDASVATSLLGGALAVDAAAVVGLHGDGAEARLAGIVDALGRLGGVRHRVLHAVVAVAEGAVLVFAQRRVPAALDDTEWAVLGEEVAENPKTTIGTCKRECESLRIDIQHWTQHSTGGKLTWQDRASLGFFKQGRIKSLAEQFQSCRMAINSVVGVAVLYASIYNGHVAEEI
ncbi:hypothetical protein PGQ11_002872 [Apiospora arundinis]|uniref:Uncharacterized protein n=1 Tax=Apiospora arundinis TaxID=335852 RepID=A0ABR2J3E2_9PEZI